MSLFDGTSRLAQIAVAFAVAGTLLSMLTGAVGGPALIGPLFLLIAAIPALISIKTERDDFGMWPNYAALGLCALALLISLPSILSSGETADVRRDGKLARDELLTREADIKSAFTSCTPDTRFGCSAAALAASPGGQSSQIAAQQECPTARQLCVIDGPFGDGTTNWTYVTRPVKSVGSLVLGFERSAQNARSANPTSCRALDPKTEPELVNAACGELSREAEEAT